MACGGPGSVTVSIGAAASERRDTDVADVTARADEDLYRAKRTRRAVWVDGQRRDAGPVTAPIAD